MKGISNLLLSSTLLLLISCGREPTELFSAPQTKEQVGLIASCTTTEQAREISQVLGLQYRVINANKKLIEFVGATKEELARALPKAKIRNNILFEKKLIAGDFSAQAVNEVQYYGAHSRQDRTESTANYFTHLEQIGAKDESHFLGEGVTIAIIDTGVYYNHPHLSPNILTNPADEHGNSADSIDNDGNGFTDDYVGWDFYNGDAYPFDDNGHGTHVAGLAASTYMGVATKAKILPIKVLSADGNGDLGTIASGILYALDRGADIINLSLGGPGASEVSAEVQSLLASIKMARGHDALIIAAAGNGGNDGVGDCNDQEPMYPASLNESNIIAVASVDSYNNLTSYSNFGIGSVHIAAPGGDPNNGGLVSTGIPFCDGPCQEDDVSYTRKMGTSMATPIVAGLAAVIKSANPGLNYQEIKNIILTSGTTTDSLKDKVKTGKVINLQNALNQI